MVAAANYEGNGEVVIAGVFGKSTSEVKLREAERLAALERLDLLDSPRDEGLERVVRLIKEIFAIDIGLVSLIDAHRQWYKSCSGLLADEVPREDSCPPKSRSSCRMRRRTGDSRSTRP